MTTVKTLCAIRHLLAVLLLLSTSACAGSYPYPFKDKLWTLSFVVPNYMEAWVESVAGRDIRGNVFSGLGGTSGSNLNNPQSEWPKGPGSLRFYRTQYLPEMLYIRWQSLVEPQTYKATVEVPQAARDKMLEPCVDWRGRDRYRSHVVLGIAPGGLVVLFLAGCNDGLVEMLRTQASIVEEGPYLGKGGGQYGPLQAHNQKFVDEYGIPYGSW